jgi:hypothetical protein
MAKGRFTALKIRYVASMINGCKHGISGETSGSKLLSMSGSRAFSRLMYTTSTEPGRIKGSSSRFPSRKLDRRQKITQVARSSPSRSWVVYIMTTAEAHEFFRERCDCLRHGRNTSEKSFPLVVLLRASRQILVVFLDEENKQETYMSCQ